MPKMKSHTASALAVLALAFATDANSQAGRNTDAESVLASTPAPSAKSPIAPLSAFAFEGGEQGGTASVKLGGQFNNSFFRRDEAVGRFGTLSLTLSAPVNKAGDFTTPLTHDGLGKAASVKLELGELTVPAADVSAGDRTPLCQATQAEFVALGMGKKAPGCSSALGSDVYAKRLSTAMSKMPVCDHVRAGLRAAFPNNVEPACDAETAALVGGPALAERFSDEVSALPECKALQAAFRARNPTAKDPVCTAALAREMGSTLLGIDRTQAINAAFARRRPLTYLGLSGEVSEESYASYDPLTLAKDEADQTPWSAGIFHAWIGPAENWSVTVSYAHKVLYEESAKGVACLNGSGPVLTCVSGPLGPVTKTKQDVLSLEGRWAPRGESLGIGGAKFGIAPKIAYDAESGDWGVGLPVYLFGGKDGLTGGVRADWDSKDHDILLGVFITKTFSISDVL